MESTSQETALDIALLVAQFLVHSHRYQNAIDLYKEILIISKLESFQAIFCFEDVQLSIHQQLTSAYYCLGNVNEAVKHAQQVVKMSIENGYRAQKATALGCLGLLYEDLKKYESSIAAYQRSLRILEEVDDRQAEVIVLNNLSSVYDRLRQYNKSVASLLKALEVLKVLGDRADKEDERKIYANLGKAYLSLCNTTSPFTIRRKLWKPATQLEISQGKHLTQSTSETCISFLESTNKGSNIWRDPLR